MSKPTPITGDTTVSSKYQIVIPKEVRERLHIQPGQRIQVSIEDNNEIRLTPTKGIDDFIGILGPSAEDPITYQRRLRQDKHYA